MQYLYFKGCENVSYWNFLVRFKIEVSAICVSLISCSVGYSLGIISAFL
jgi:hypothetical protein